MVAFSRLMSYFLGVIGLVLIQTGGECSAPLLLIAFQRGSSVRESSLSHTLGAADVPFPNFSCGDSEQGPGPLIDASTVSAVGYQTKVMPSQETVVKRNHYIVHAQLSLVLASLSE